MIIITSVDIIIMLYSDNGRYSKQSWQNEDNYTYFGTMNNDKPHGWGKLFDEEDIESSDYAYYSFDDKSLWSYRKGDTETLNADLDDQQRQEIIEKWPMPKKTIWD